MLEEGRGPRVPRSRGPKDQDISNSHSNTSLTLKKVHLVVGINESLFGKRKCDYKGGLDKIVEIDESLFGKRKCD